jgi:hypothetical protein
MAMFGNRQPSGGSDDIVLTQRWSQRRLCRAVALRVSGWRKSLPAWRSWTLGIIRYTIANRTMKTYLIKYSLLILIFVCSTSHVFALDLKSEDGNYTFTVPGTWTLTFQNQAGFSIASSNGKRTMTLLIANARSGKLDPSFIAKFEQAVQRAGAEKVSSKMFAIDGVPAYEIVQRIGKSPFATVMIDHQIIANNRVLHPSRVSHGWRHRRFRDASRFGQFSFFACAEASSIWKIWLFRSDGNSFRSSYCRDSFPGGSESGDIDFAR